MGMERAKRKEYQTDQENNCNKDLGDVKDDED